MYRNISTETQGRERRQTYRRKKDRCVDENSRSDKKTNILTGTYVSYNGKKDKYIDGNPRSGKKTNISTET